MTKIMPQKELNIRMKISMTDLKEKDYIHIKTM